ncbi:polyprenyl synthetase family protein [Acetobacter persici]|uniref:polyprenyl synthetase family protein n=1 Tax=Acetobacter persici TaxID=1076596 RepID=UPI000A363C31|nr:polyprenyl synthetase family protein [Acetobacter persici]OUI91782.1 farnesyltranstransferase [Acetobacter persici]
MGVAVSLPESGRATSQDGSSVSVSKPGEAGLKALADYLAQDMRVCNQVIVARMQSPVALIPQLAAHLVAAGGKRLRPLLTLAAARLCGYDNQDGKQRHVEIAACVEFIHTATLLHDDVVDESQLRRGLASANAIFGNKASVLVGDFLFARAFQILTADASLDVMAILSAASATLAEGEVMQMTTQNDLSTSVDQYLQVIYGKTAALFAAACEAGAVIGESSPEWREALRVYGANLGMAFQLVDDALDYAADQAVLGKEVGDDFREGKVTLPVLAAYEAGSEEDRVFWRRVIEESEQQPEDLDAALDRIARTDAIGVTLRKAEEYAAKAREALALFPECEIRSLLIETASYSASRER